MLRAFCIPTFLALALALTPRGAAAQERICGSAPFDAAPEAVGALIAQLEPVTEAFDSLRRALDTPGLELCLVRPLFDARGFLEPEATRIVIDADLAPGLRLAVLVHELRHLQQVSVGVCPGPDLAMRAYADAVFAMEADASVTALVVAWDLREKGQAAMWRALETWPMQEDIAESFAAGMARGDDPAAAASAAFDQWYQRPDRVAAYDRAACWDYLEAQDRGHLLPSYGALDPAYYDRLCRLPDGASYDCADPRGDGAAAN
ncbi:DUF6782 family putative metallopeptidase [Aestuariicoccus sp. MJ-SS9]|uniref:DUF6782 family putative metallopeptidase n=1 Tax=Aestuariicoccus sp. MJ-SS9 TaxID=3079855 RepID=UPI0029159BF2|nr:DUF6782 family putative metallopeptidase [Aestuariicoccus sp. MJ-SS9]MDU8911794.1 DUF6782 family putative metallopeptidase [Aestuariicoccus sp. MJ-SS9]